MTIPFLLEHTQTDSLLLGQRCFPKNILNNLEKTLDANNRNKSFLKIIEITCFTIILPYIIFLQPILDQKFPWFLQINESYGKII